MFSHVMIGVNDMEASKKFYDATMQVLGYKPGIMDEKGRCFYLDKSGVFALTKPINGEPACHGNGTTLGFKVESTEQAEAWHAAGVANGGVACEDPPGVRGEGENKMHLAYLRDPAGNKICTLIRV
ncbi:MAG: VOC family protein [Paraglaciecola chathamensis]|jgi:catechol 2,3-dioxygenase-like lactoylglutathione lyase family enzyme|uniref:VOC family protein n=1 Tax=Paraglaciecola chathamensis TaxID=368405 RepID=A0ABS0WF16_9ALTE|nr:VOC family protein [Paraglaciecola chathamensis]AEE22880.1 Glyoxalase/bleomycin resistance protein/dioxygenase [Glaciecola sp. 4H-3-7+YE-5]MBJ2137033.1 VOC family protein [Paraglaciecola chathamensis]